MDIKAYPDVPRDAVIRQGWRRKGHTLVATVLDTMDGEGAGIAGLLREELGLTHDQARYMADRGSQGKGTVMVKGAAALNAFTRGFPEVQIQKETGWQIG